MRKLWQDESGQGMAIPVIALVAMVAMTAFVVDVGSWFRADRAAQAVADAAVLAGAQALPHDPGRAAALAEEYAAHNDGSGTLAELVVFKDRQANDSIRVRVSRDVPGFFARIFSIDTVTVGAAATARASSPASAKWVAPITVSEKHPDLNCTAPGVCAPYFGKATSFSLINLHSPGSGDAAGAFGLLNLIAGDKGSIGESTMAEWLASGYEGYMNPGIYTSVPSAMFNGNAFRDALTSVITEEQELLFPIYRTLKESGATAEYGIVGWVGFVITNVVGSGANSEIHGHFTRVVWEGVPSTSSTETPNFGAFTVHLTN